MRRLVTASLAWLGLVSACLAQSPSQGPPDFGIDTSGTLRNLSVRDATLGSRVPLGILDTTTHAFVAPTVLVESYGAVSGDLLDDKAAIQAAMTAAAAAGSCVTGSGKPYRIDGSVLLPNGACLQDITLVQTQSGAGVVTRTLTNSGTAATGPFTLRNVKIDYTAVGLTAGIGNGEGSNGLYIRDSHDIDIDGLEITGSGRSYGGTIYNSTNVKVSRLWVHDIWSEGSVEPEHEVGGGFDFHTNTDLQLTNFRIERLGSSVSWSPSTDLSKSQGKPWRYNAGKSYRATIYPAGTTGTTPPTCTSGTCSDGTITWEYMGAYPAVRRNYQMDGLHVDNIIRGLISNGIVKNVWEGFDHTSAYTEGLSLSNMLYADVDAYGEKWGYCVVNAGSIGSRVIRAGLGGFVIGSGVVANCGPDHFRWIDGVAYNTGSNNNWTPNDPKGFSLGFDNTPGVYDPPHDVQLINPTVIDDQVPAKTKYGIVASGAVPTAAQLLVMNPRVDGAIATPYQNIPQGMIQILPTDGSTKVTGNLAVTGALAVSAWPVTAPDGVITLKRIDAGVPVIPLYIGNTLSGSPVLGSAALIDASATGQNNVRSVQFGGEITVAGQNGQKFTVKTSANADIPRERFWCGLGCVVGTPAGGDQGAGTVNVGNGIYDNGVLLSSTYARLGVTQTFTQKNTFAITSAGAQTVPLVVGNGGNTVGTEGCIELAANTAGTRSAQICGTNPGGTGSETGLVLRTALGATPVTRFTITPAGLMTFALPIQVTAVATASLPACNAGREGSFGSVTDANSTTYNVAAAGGGANHMPVYCNGTAWVLH